MPIVDKHVRVAARLEQVSKLMGLALDGWKVFYDPTPLTEKGVLARVYPDVESYTAVVRFSRAALRRTEGGQDKLHAHELLHVYDAPLEEELKHIEMSDAQRRRINDLLEHRCNMLENIVAKAFPSWAKEED